MNKRTVVETWAERCRYAQQAGPRGQAMILEHKLLESMQNEIPGLPAPAKGCVWVSFEFSLLGNQMIDVEYCPEDDQTNRVFINGADISELFADVRADVSMKLDQQAYDAYCKQCEEARAA